MKNKVVNMFGVWTMIFWKLQKIGSFPEDFPFSPWRKQFSIYCQEIEIFHDRGTNTFVVFQDFATHQKNENSGRPEGRIAKRITVAKPKNHAFTL